MTIATPVGRAFPAAVRRPTVTMPVTIYATWWNLTGLRIRRMLRSACISHHLVDIGLHPDAKTLLRGAVGDDFDLPVVYVDGDWLIAPSLDDLKVSLQKHGLCAKP